MRGLMTLSLAVCIVSAGRAAAVEYADELTQTSPLFDGRPYSEHRFEAKGGQWASISLTAGFDAYLVLVSPSGLEWHDDDGGDGTNSLLNVMLDADGVYVVKAACFGPEAEGEYELRIRVYGEAAPPGSGTNRLERGRLTPAHPARDEGEHYEEYSFEAQAGQTARVSMKSVFDAYLIMNGPDGSTWNDDDGGGGTNALLNVTVNASGTYRVLATSYEAAEFGDYELAISVYGAPAAEGEGTRRTVNGTLDIGSNRFDGKLFDNHWFEALPGQRASISMKAGFDAFLILESPDGQIWRDDDGGEGSNALLNVFLESAGEYLVQATSYEAGEAGDYELTIDIQGAGVPGGVGEPRVEGGRLGPASPRLSGKHFRDYSFEGRAGQAVTISMVADFDAYVILYAPGGQTWNDDDGGEGRHSLLKVSLEETGTYRVRATSASLGETGRYKLSIESGEDGGGRGVF